MSGTESTSRTSAFQSIKITDSHRAKLAVVNVRQSSPQQVVENRESLARQYSLEWWIRDLADELGVGYSRIKEWVGRGYVHARRVGSRRHLVIGADAKERDRLRRLRDAFGPGRTFQRQSSSHL